MIFVLVGAPGAGKGTQADLLVQSEGFRKISTGDLLRREIAAGSPLGLRVKAIVEGGDLVADDILVELIGQELSRSAGNKLLLDGFPRNLAQAEALATLPAQITGVIYLEVPDVKIVDRLSRRLVCVKCGSPSALVANVVPGPCAQCGGELKTRADDERAKVQKRLQIYRRETEPILAYYEARGLLHKVNGDQDEKTVHNAVLKLVQGH